MDRFDEAMEAFDLIPLNWAARDFLETTEAVHVSRS